MHKTPLFGTIAAILIILAGGTTPAGATDWLQFGYDTAHSGFNRAETGYSTSGNTIAYHYALPSGSDSADSAPVYLGNVATSSGTKNILFILTNNGTFLGARRGSTALNVLWSHQPTGAGTTTAGLARAPSIPTCCMSMPTGSTERSTSTRSVTAPKS